MNIKMMFLWTFEIILMLFIYVVDRRREWSMQILIATIN